MSKKFITPVSMYCTKEQYEKDLKEALKKMGYKEHETFKWAYNELYITNNFAKNIGILGFGRDEDKLRNSRYFIDHYNPKLFLALAAMTEGEVIEYGEYYSIKSLGGDLYIHQCKVNHFDIKISLSMEESVTDFRKLTKEELIKYFNKNKLMEKVDLRGYLCSGNIVTFHNNLRGVIIETQVGKIIFAQNNIVRPIESWDEKLETKECKDLRIEQIHQIQQNSSSNLYLMQSKEVWRRRPRYTLNELIMKAGLETKRLEVELPDKTLIIL